MQAYQEHLVRLIRYLAQVYPAGALNQASHEIWACLSALLFQWLICEAVGLTFRHVSWLQQSMLIWFQSDI